MSLNTAENLLKQYNKKNTSQESTSAKPRFGTFVYANPVDAAYDKYSNDKNFNINMWQDAIAAGEQDKYIALLERNQGRQLSAQFYDPQYYDYETMMLELYQPFAAQDDTKEYFKDVYDPGTDKWVEESIGEMNSSQYIQYQLNQIRAQRSDEITRQLEQWRKDQMSFAEKLGHDILSTGAEFGEGILSATAGLLDFVLLTPSLIGSSAASAVTGDASYLDSFVEAFSKHSLTALEKQTIRAALDEYERTHTHFRDIDGNMTGWGKYIAGISNSIGMMVPSMLMAIPTGGTSLAWMGQATFYTSLFSQNLYENATNPMTMNSPSYLKVINAAFTTGAEVVIERSLNAFLGGTIQNQMIGMNGGLKSAFKGVSTKAAWGYIGKSALQEGLEEFLQDYSTECINQFTSLLYKGYGKTGFTFQTLIDSFFAGAISSVVLSGGAIARNAIERGWRNTRTDPETGKITRGAGDTVIEIEKFTPKKFKTGTVTKKSVERSTDRLTATRSTQKTVEVEKLTGVKELYFKTMLGNFNQAIKDLRDKKMSDKKTIALAQEVYGAFSALSQYYSSLTPERVKNMEILLKAVIDNEKSLEAVEGEEKLTVRDKAVGFATLISASFDGAYKNTKANWATKFKDSVKRKSKELEESGATTTTTSATDNTGETHFPEKDVEEIKKRLNTGKLNGFTKDYSFVYTTDGRLAVEDGDVLFVPEDWIENYTPEEVQKFFAQNRIVKEIVNNPGLSSMVKDLIPFVKEFTGQEDVDAETAVMDLLFHPSVYQGFLLLDRGKNLHTHMANITNLHKTILDIGNGKIEMDKRLSEKTKEKRKAYLAQIIEQIKTDTMRKPIIKAAINWKMDLQKIRADGILDEEDKKYIKSRTNPKDVIRKVAKGGPITAEYKNLAEDILRNVTNSKTRDAIEKGLRDDATIDERVQAAALLDLFDDQLFITNDLMSQKHVSFVPRQTITLPVEVTNLRAADAEFVADKLIEFEELYGIAAEALLAIGPTNLSRDAQIRLKNDMDLYNTDDLFIFIQKKLEDMLGHNFVIVPKRIVMDRGLEGDITEDLTYITDFEVCKKIGADNFLTSEILDLPSTERNLVFETTIKNVYVENLRSQIDKIFATKYPSLDERSKAIWRENLVASISTDKDGVLNMLRSYTSPITGAIYYDEIEHEPINIYEYRFWSEVKTLLENTETSMYISDILDLSVLPEYNRAKIGATRVFYEDLGESKKDLQGYADEDNNGLYIVINARATDAIETLIHEFNHIIQAEYDLPGGSNQDVIAQIPELILYVCTHYSSYIEAACNIPDVNKALKAIPDLEHKIKLPGANIERMLNTTNLNWAVYRLISGEMFARDYMHNIKRDGFSIVDNMFDKYIVSPDGKTKFAIPQHIQKNLDMSKSSTLTPAVQDAVNLNKLERSILNAVKNNVFGDKRRNTRSTYHAELSNYEAGEIIDRIVAPGVSPFEKNRLTINDIILNPQRYCNDNIMDMLDGEYDEGTAYSVIRSYLEETFGNISIDVSAGSHEYVLVDDNAFDDMYNLAIRPRIDSNQDTIVSRYRNLDRNSSAIATLSSFYKPNILKKIGVDENIKVIIGDRYKTQVQYDGHDNLVIYINSRKGNRNRTDAEFLNTLNHEFRHVLQFTFGFALGFTPDFKVTDDMIKDLKEQAPRIFKDKELLNGLRSVGITSRDADVWIVQHTIYSLTAGELNASGILSEMIEVKPWLVDREGGKIKIFSPFYDPETGYGAYETEYLASRSEDDALEEKPKSTQKKSEPIKEVRRKLVEIRLNRLIDEYVNSRDISDNMKNTIRNYIISDSDVIDDKIEKLKTKEKLSKSEKKQLEFYKKVVEARIDILQRVLKYSTELNNTPPKEVRAKYAVHQEQTKELSEDERMLKDIEKSSKGKSTKNTNFVVKVNKKQLAEELAERFGNNRMRISKKRAGDTNLKYYVGKELHPVVAAFIEATTGLEEQLPTELVYSIKKKYINHDSLYGWVKEVPIETLIEYPKAFELINDILFNNNPHIDSAEKLQSVINETPALYWALAIVLREARITDEQLLRESKVPELIQYLMSTDPTWVKRLEYYKTKFYPQNVDPNNEVIKGYARLCALEWYDDTIVGGAYFANQVRIAYGRWNAGKVTSTSIDATRDGKDDNDMEMQIADEADEEDEDTNIAEGSTNTEVAGPGNSLIALYETDILAYSDKSENDMIYELIQAKHERMVDAFLSKQEKLSDRLKNKVRDYLFGEKMILSNDIAKIRDKRDLTDKDLSRLRFLETIMRRWEKIWEELLTYQGELRERTPEELARLYSSYRLSEITNTAIDKEVDTGEMGTGKIDGRKRAMDKDNVQRRLKRLADRLISYTNDDAVDFSWNDVPDDVKDFFEITENNGKQSYELKGEIHLVGRGAKKLNIADYGTKGMQYSQRRDLNKEYDLSKDYSHIIDNESRLRTVVENAKKLINERARIKKEMDDKSKRVDEKLREPEKKKVKKRIDESGKELYQTEIKTEKERKGKKIKAQRNNKSKYLNVHSGKPMPKVLETILDTSFTEMRDTLVQYVTKDKDGNLLTKESNPKEFESSVQHEKVNWDQFYELNRVELNELSRTDALSIIDFVNSAPFTLTDLNSNLFAFLTFTVGYIIEGAKFNHHNWNFSDAEVALCEETFQAMAHSAGLLLNTVRQMQQVINPYRKVSQRSLEDFGIPEADLGELFKSIDDLQRGKDKTTRDKAATKVLGEIKKLEERMVNPQGEKTWARRWSKIKSFRYVSMLSSPATWMRNVVSNYFLLSFNGLSDQIAKMFFAKRGYLESSWDLSNTTQIDPDVANFIKNEIVDNEIFDPLFENQNKYDNRVSNEKISTRDTFRKLIIQAMRNKYVSEHRFDSKTMNRIQGFINRVIGDKKFMKNAATKYLGRILTIEKARGNVDISQGLTNEVLSYFAEAVILSSHEYMHKTSLLSDMIEPMRAKHPLLYEALTFWQPFMNSGFNWFIEFLKYSPIGLTASIVRLSKLEKQIAAVEARRAAGETVADPRAAEFLLRRDIGKGVIGLGLSVAGVLLALAGILRIDEEDEKIYMYVKDVKVDISSLFGSSSVLAGAAIAQAWTGNDVSLEDVLVSFTKAAFEGFVINDLISRHQYDDNLFDYMTTKTESAMKSFVPQAWQLLIRFTNGDKIRYSPGILGGIERWLNTFLPTQPLGDRVVNIYTGEAQAKYTIPFLSQFGASGIVVGLKIYDGSVGKVEDFAIEHGVNKGELGNSIKIGNKEYSMDKQKLNNKYGQLNSDTLLDLKNQKHNVQMEDGSYKILAWNKLNDKQKERVIDRTMTRNAQIAKIYYWTQELGHKYYASYSMWNELRKLGITQNVYKGDKDFVE